MKVFRMQKRKKHRSRQKNCLKNQGRHSNTSKSIHWNIGEKFEESSTIEWMYASYFQHHSFRLVRNSTGLEEKHAESPDHRTMHGVPCHWKAERRI